MQILLGINGTNICFSIETPPFLWSDFVYLYILQQRYMIAALEEHASLSSEGPEKTDVVKETARYLQACHLIFEKGILSHVFIRSNESAVLKNIQQGWRYFEEWAEEHNNTGM